jgi:hypothetical protein
VALHPQFPSSPYAELLPEQRWFPATEDLRSTAYEKLVPPLVAALRRDAVKVIDIFGNDTMTLVPVNVG